MWAANGRPCGLEQGSSIWIHIVIRKITADEAESALALAPEVFMQFEAPDKKPGEVAIYVKARANQFFRRLV